MISKKIERRRNKQRKNKTKEEVSTLKGKFETLQKESDDQEQYSRINCILVH